MTASILATTFDCQDPLLVAQFWATALGYAIDDLTRGVTRTKLFA
jgi:hypothetical protein